MKIAITGANGFVGRNLARHFQVLGHEPVAVVRPGADLSLMDFPCLVQTTDYNDQDSLGRALQDAELVIHNAGKVRTRSFAEMVEANVATTRQLIRAANRSSACRQFVFISSQAASRPTLEVRAVTEDETSAPVDWYGRSKVLAERLVRAECSVNWTIVRPASVYGPGERDFLVLYRAVQSGLKIRLGARERQLSLIHIQQLAQFIELCLDRQEAFGQVFFASDGQSYCQSQFLALIEQELGRRALTLTVPLPLARIVSHVGDIYERISGRITLFNTQKMQELLAPNWICSIDKAKALLGWDPQPELAKRLRQTLAWYREHGWL